MSHPMSSSYPHEVHARRTTRNINNKYQQQHNLLTHGWFRGKIPTYGTLFGLDKLKSELYVELDQNAKTIFNGHTNDTQNDMKRSQAPLRRYTRVMEDIKRTIMNQLKKYIDLENVYEFRDWVVLHSLPGCDEQIPHTDVDPNEVRKHLNGVPPLVCLVSVQEGTRLVIWDKVYGRIEPDLEPYDFIIMRGDTIHAGSAYEKENVRIHVFLDPMGYKRPRDKTYPV